MAYQGNWSKIGDMVILCCRLIERMIKNFLKKVYTFLLTRNPSKKLFLERISPEIIQFEIVFDIGSYQGSFIDEVLSLNRKVSIHCFEPSTEAYNFLSNKYKDDKNVKINNLAVSDFSGLSVLNINSYKETNSLLQSVTVNDQIDSLTKNEAVESVKVITLMDYCVENGIGKIDLIKIDTQGNSFNVLKGLEPMLQNRSVNFLYVEAEFLELYKDEKLFSEIEIFMRMLGYNVLDIYNLNYLNKERLAWCDVLFRRKEN
jgi:FkbM family methyltransferase